MNTYVHIYVPSYVLGRGRRERVCVECRVSSSSWLRVLRNGSSVEQTCMGRHGVDGVNDGQG
jgi:hypothetical protein